MKTPKLQIALDAINLHDAIKLIEQIEPLVDIVEVGTPFLIEYGLQVVTEMKKRFPSVEVLCDGKIMDAGAYEAQTMFDAGADWVTVMALTDELTIQECVTTAAKNHGKVMVDMLCVHDVPEKTAFLQRIGVDCIAVHTGVDQQSRGQTALDDLRLLKQYVTRSLVAVAGGIKAATMASYLALSPDILIVGGGIVEQPDPLAAAKAIRTIMNASGE